MKNENNESMKAPRKNARELIVAKLSKRFPDRALDNDDDFFDALAEYDSRLCERYERLCNDQNKLASLFVANPKMGAFISDVIGGEDPLIACVRHFGKDILECADDEDRMSQIRKENDEFLERMARQRETEKTMQENLEHSQRAIARFKEAKGMDDDDFENFMGKVYHVCEHVFMGDFTPDVLELLFKGIHYDNDLDCAEKAAIVKGRNERISLEKKQREGDAMPDLRSSRSAGDDEDEDLTPAFGLRRRRSIWDL